MTTSYLVSVYQAFSLSWAVSMRVPQLQLLHLSYQVVLYGPVSTTTTLSIEDCSSHNCFIATNCFMLPKQKSSGIIIMTPCYHISISVLNHGSITRRRGSEGEGGIYATVGRRAGRRRTDGEVSTSFFTRLLLLVLILSCWKKGRGGGSLCKCESEEKRLWGRWRQTPGLILTKYRIYALHLGRVRYQNHKNLSG